MTLVFLYNVSRSMVAAMERMTIKYATKVSSSPYSVPFGIALLGCFRSPDMLAPLADVSDWCQNAVDRRSDTPDSARRREYPEANIEISTNASPRFRNALLQCIARLEASY